MRARENTLEETQSTESSSTTPEGGTKSDFTRGISEEDFNSANDQMVSEASEAKDPETSDPVEDQEKHSDLTLEQDLGDKDPPTNTLPSNELLSSTTSPRLTFDCLFRTKPNVPSSLCSHNRITVL